MNRFSGMIIFPSGLPFHQDYLSVRITFLTLPSGSPFRQDHFSIMIRLISLRLSTGSSLK